MEKREKKVPRVLVSTVGAWSDTVGSDTMSSLFREYDKEKLACLYIRADMSDSNSCNHYFHIYEGRVMRSFIHPRTQTGEEYRLNDNTGSAEEVTREHARYRFFKKYRSYLFLLAREIIWNFGRWKTKELNEFIDSFDPEVLVCPLEGYIHFNRINEFIIARKRPKVVGFLWDDNFTYKPHAHSIGFIIHRFWLRRSIRKLIRRCDTVFALSPKMKEECDKEFGIDSTLLTKPIFNQPDFTPYEPESPIRILYTGNLYVNRDRTIAHIVDAIKAVNSSGSQRVVLDIYTSTALSEKMARRIQMEACCTVHGSIKQTEVLHKQRQADILLFAESLSDNESQAARLSFSTKITDYLSAGRCIWAVGNPKLSAIDYLKRTDAALISSDVDSIHRILNQIVSDKDLILQYARKGHECGRTNHNAELILGRLNKAIDE